jgi:hypothetical protein
MDTKLIQRLNCECNPGKIYASKSTFNKHRSSKRHKQWELQNQELDHRKTITKLQNYNTALETKFKRLEQRYNKLKGLYEKSLKTSLNQNKSTIFQ